MSLSHTFLSEIPACRADRIVQITCLYDMDIPRPDNFNETYLYEGNAAPLVLLDPPLIDARADGM